MEKEYNYLYICLLAAIYYLDSTEAISAVSNIEEVQSNSGDYSFNPLLMGGSGITIDQIQAVLDNGSIGPGKYSIDVFVNGHFIFRDDVLLSAKNRQLVPCFTSEQISQFGIKESIVKKILSLAKQGKCILVSDISEFGIPDVDTSNFKVDMVIPNVLLDIPPQGQVKRADLQAGETMVFANYSFNQYYARFKGIGSHTYQSAWVGLHAGFNLGQWRFRQQGAYDSKKEGHSHWSSNRKYIQRAIVPLGGELLVGESYSGGNFFSGMAFTGIQLTSDDRLLADSQRGYAPVIHGVAKTNAKVSVRQGKSVIYEVNIAPGAFEINDLYATPYTGDLDVTVTEADGTVSNFTVPFSAVPESIRSGMSRYSIILGRVRDAGNSVFNEMVWQHGLSNSITSSLSTRFAYGYQAASFGLVSTTRLGALGADATFSNAQLPIFTSKGWMLHLAYSKMLAPTNTTITIASHYYFTDGFYDLNDVLGLRRAAREDIAWSSSTYQQRSRIEVSINQDMGQFGNLYLAGSKQEYRDGHSRDMQYQFGYNKQFSNGVGLTMSVAKVCYAQFQGNGSDSHDPMPEENIFANKSGSWQTSTAIAVSIPFGELRRDSISATINYQGGQGNSYQASYSGFAGKTQPISYGINLMKNSDELKSVSGTVQSAFPYANLQAGASKADHYTQTSLGAQGAIVVHRGGVTLGPYVGDTFALIEAKGAQNAKVVGEQGVSIDRFGYALAPSLTPYRYNDISLDPAMMNNHAELFDSAKRVSPIAGAMLRVKFKVDQGYPLLISIKRGTGADLPMGAKVYNSDNVVVGMVGQANQAYVRNNKISDKLHILFGHQRSCYVDYNINKENKSLSLIHVAGECQP